MTVENIPDPNDFTKEIEGTIDNLFNPTKKIVIDPLTNEIKEVEEKELQLELEESKEQSDNNQNKQAKEENIEQLEIDSEDTSEELLLVADNQQTTEEAKNLNDNNEILEIESKDLNKTNQENIDEELEFELELENEEPQSNAILDSDTYVDEKIELIQKLEQVVLTVEWEITPKLVEEALKIVKQLKDKLSDNQTYQSKSLDILVLMEEIIEYLLIAPDKLPTNTTVVLKRGVKILKDILTNIDVSNKDLKDIISNFESILDNYKNTSKTESKPLDKPKQTKQIVEDSDKQRVKKEESIDPRIKDLLLDTIKKQLIILDECIDKIIPIEQTLSKVKETQKLYLFHKTLREELEKQYNYIINNLKKVDLLPEQFLQKKDRKKAHISTKPIEDLIEKKKTIQCPWTRLLGVNWDNRFSAIPLDIEIVYNGPIPRKAKNQVKTSNNIELSKFKTWPWTKIKNLFSGSLAQKSEEELKSLKIPIIDNPAASQLFGSDRLGNHLIIMDTPKGFCAIVTSGPPQEIPGPFDKNWEPEKGENNPVAGYIKQGAQKIPVIRLEQLIK